MLLQIKKDAWYIIAKRLIQHKITKVFGMVGDGAGLLEASRKLKGLDALACRDQRSSVAMAMGYSQATGSCAIYCTSSGPGLMNSLLGILEAESGCLPIIIFSNGVSRGAKGTGAFQEVDSISLLRPLVKWCYRVESEEKLIWAVDRAIQLAINGKPKPIYIEIPNDLINIADLNNELPLSNITQYRFIPDVKELENTAFIIKKHEKIVLLIGGGCKFSNANNIIEKFACRINAAVFSTASGRNIYPETSQLACGLMGLYVSHPAEKIIQSCDLLIVLGSQLEETCLMGVKSYLENKTIIQVDIDYETINKSIIASHALIGDIKLTLEYLMGFLNEEKNNVEWLALIKQVKKTQNEYATYDVKKYPVRSLYHAITESKMTNKIIVVENGLNDIWGYTYPLLQLMKGDICITPAEQTGLGLAFGQAIGAKFAFPDRYTIVIAGDGAFTLGRNALYTAAENNLGIVCIIFNSGGFSWSNLMQENDNISIGCQFILQEDYRAFCQSINAIYHNPKSFPEILALINSSRTITEEKKIVFIEINADVIDIPSSVKTNFLGQKIAYESIVL